MLIPLIRSGVWRLLLALAIVAGASPCQAQTVIPNPPPPSGPDSGARARADTAPGAAAQAPGAVPSSAGAPVPAAAPAPAPGPAAAAETGPPAPKGVCSDLSALGPGGVSADVVLVTFRRRSTPEQREAAVKVVKGTILAPDPTDDASAYVRVPSDGNEFALRAIADRLIRVAIVKEVGPVQCSAGP